MSVLLSTIDVSKRFDVNGHIVQALDAVSFDVVKGECLAIVGESGSGKSTIANIILGIYGASSGRITFDGTELPARRTKAHRRAIQLVQQNPLSSLNPRRSIGASLRLALDVHDLGDMASRNQRTGELLEEVGLPADFRSRSPSSLSGGQRQRVAIARALILEPKVLLLDEPTSALDVSVQAEVLNLLKRLRRERGLTYLLVTHNLPVVSFLCDRLAVMRKGRIEEIADVAALKSGRLISAYGQALYAASMGEGIA